MSKPSPVTETFEPADRKGWRAWLRKHHAVSSGVWLVYTKQPDRNLSYPEAVEEALCFGWVDSRPNKIDDTRYKQLFSPRKPTSAWSKINKERVARLIEAGLMTAAGLAKVEAARANGAWAHLDAVEDLEMPPDFARALAANTAARRNFEAFSRSSRKIILGWIHSAKRLETRVRRIAEAVDLAARGIKANHYRQ